MKLDNNTVGVVIGRFQIDNLHAGHVALLDRVTELHDRVVVLLGIRPTAANKNNPLSFEIRRSMILDSYPNIIVLPISDQRSNTVWSNNVDVLLRLTVAESPIQMYTGRHGFNDRYTGKHDVIELSLSVDSISSVDRRNDLKVPNFIVPDRMFRAGIIHGMMVRYPRTDRTVDMAVFTRSGKQDGQFKLALGRKYNETEWRLPGGFVDPGEPDEFAASRETLEEIGISVEIPTWEYCGNYSIDDWRCRDADDHFFRTTLFTTILPWHSFIKAGDDIQEAKWVDLDDVKDLIIVSEHKKLIKHALKWLETHNREGE